MHTAGLLFGVELVKRLENENESLQSLVWGDDSSVLEVILE